MTTTPTDADRQAAEKLLVQLRRTTSHSEGAGSINLPISALLHAISQAIADARAVKPGHVRLDTGEEVPHLGPAWRTTDGAVIGKGSFWALYRGEYDEDDAPIRIGKARLGSDPEDSTPFYQIDDCNEERVKIVSTWATKQAAESALAARGGEVKKVLTTTTWTCDVCGCECVPVGSRQHVFHYVPIDAAGVRVGFTTFGYQCPPSDACVCTKCAVAAMKGIIKELEPNP